MDKQIKGFFDVVGKTIKDSSEKTFLKAVGSETTDIDAFKEDLNRTFNDKIKKIDKYGSIFEVCKFHKYPLEKFVYETKDGYYNTVFHINGPRGSDARTNS